MILTHSPTISARRMLQTGATFAAFGGLTLAAAMPAQAETITVGTAHSAVLEERVSLVPSVAQGEEGSDTQHYQGRPEPYLDVDLTGTSTVDADGLHSSIEVGSVHAQLTEEDLGQILAQEDTEDVQSFGTIEELRGESAGTLDTQDEDYAIDVEFTDASIQVTQGWDGEYTVEFAEGQVQVNHTFLPMEVSLTSVEGQEQVPSLEDEEFLFDASFGGMVASFDAGVAGFDFAFAEVLTGTAEVEADDEDPGNGDPGEGDDGDPDPGEGEDGKEDEDDEDGGEEDGQEDGKDPGEGEDDKDGRKGDGEDEGEGSLPVTGGALAGLIAAGTAVAAGGGAALYFTRRKKNEVTGGEAADES
ncbi:LPXTG cell wall anchor domain-containing protein [Nocardiopsis xinjiangensis]|uniref:LPXTG cell wall anchor domain-containing protein n=1 Tax=Nocardiopsis xinjiangensis TaxID=124285 RepID=UPI00037AFAA4|nr:LPXTG cell wall anchor domain-containing protein [Nocardiopsis xinjiangensis]